MIFNNILLTLLLFFICIEYQFSSAYQLNNNKAKDEKKNFEMRVNVCSD